MCGVGNSVALASEAAGGEKRVATQYIRIVSDDTYYILWFGNVNRLTGLGGAVKVS
jgi:hypothetical protein